MTPHIPRAIWGLMVTFLGTILGLYVCLKIIALLERDKRKEP